MSRSRRAKLVAAGATLCAGALLGGTAGLTYAQGAQGTHGHDAGARDADAPGTSAQGSGPRSLYADDNGITGMNAGEIVKKSREAVQGAQSLQIRLTMDSASENDDPKSVDLAVDRDGNCAGTIGYAADGGNFEIVKRGQDVWLKADSAWWRANFGAEAAQQAAQYEGKYLKASASEEDLRDMVELCELSEYRDEALDTLGTDSLKKGEEKTVDDTKALELTGTDDGDDVTVAVATEGKPYPVRVTRAGDEPEQASLTFDHPVPSNTPAASETEPWPDQQ